MHRRRDAPPIRDWATRVKQALSSVGTGPVQVVWIGDSTTNGSTATATTNRAQNIVQARLRGRYPVAGVSGDRSVYIPTEYSAAVLFESEEPTGAGPTILRGTGAGFSIRGATLKVDDTLTLTKICTRIIVWYGKSPTKSDFTVAIDGGDPVAVSSLGASNLGGYQWDSGPLSDEEHTIVVTGSLNRASGASIEAFSVFHGPEDVGGVTVIDGGKSSAKAADWGETLSNLNQIRDDFTTMQPPMVLICLGINDIRAGHTAARFIGNLRLMTNTAISVCSIRPSFLILMSSRPSLSGSEVTTWSEYCNGARDFARSQGFGYFDIRSAFPEQPTSNSDSSDGIHFLDAGYVKYAEAVDDFLRRAGV